MAARVWTVEQPEEERIGVYYLYQGGQNATMATCDLSTCEGGSTFSTDLELEYGYWILDLGVTSDSIDCLNRFTE